MLKFMLIHQWIYELFYIIHNLSQVIILVPGNKTYLTLKFLSLVMTLLLDNVFYNCSLTVVSAGKIVQVKSETFQTLHSYDSTRFFSRLYISPDKMMSHILILALEFWQEELHNWQLMTKHGTKEIRRRLSGKVLTKQTIGPDTESQAPYKRSQPQCCTSVNPVEVGGWRMETGRSCTYMLASLSGAASSKFNVRPCLKC